jgi:hypothetical protein
MKPVFNLTLSVQLGKYVGEWDETRRLTPDEVRDIEDECRFTFCEYTDAGKVKAAFHKLLDDILRNA